MKLEIIFYVIFFVVLHACTINKIRILDDSLFQNTISLEKQEPNVNGLTYIDDIIICNKDIVIKNNREDSIFMVYRLSDFSLVNAFGNKGRGPLEYQVPKIVQRPDSCLWIYDFGVNKFMKINTQTGERRNCMQRLPVKDWPQEILFLHDSSYIYENFNKENGEIVKYDSSRTVLYSFSDLKKKIKDPQGYRGFIDVNAKTGDIVYVYQYLRRFDILDKEGEIKSINLFRGTELPFMNGDKLNYRKSLTYYFDVTTTDDRIYLYYVGKTGDAINRNYKFNTYIEEYDWDGNPQKRYVIDQFVKSILFYKGKFVCVALSSESPFLLYQ